MHDSDDKIIVDTSTLIALSKIAQLHILNTLYDRICVTASVKEEFSENLPEWIKTLDIKNINLVYFFSEKLGSGESETITVKKCGGACKCANFQCVFFKPPSFSFSYFDINFVETQNLNRQKFQTQLSIHISNRLNLSTILNNPLILQIQVQKISPQQSSRHGLRPGMLFPAPRGGKKNATFFP